ncbi:NAD/NADP octopine/nopaline dehydrogenase family protein [Chloroflexota bacterium]
MRKIAVLGAGGTGHAITADLTLAGFEVKLYEGVESKEKLEGILKLGGIEISGALGDSFANFNNVTTEIEEALNSVEIILVAIPALRHEKIARICAPYLVNGQTIVIGPDNGGSLVFNNIFTDEKVKANVHIAGITGNYYSCRMVGPAKVQIALPRRTKRIAAFPAKYTETVISKLNCLKCIYDFTAGTNILEIALSSANLVTHLAGSLLNAGAIEKSGGEYYLYRQGITSSILRCRDAVEKERMAVFEVMGYTINPSDILEKVARTEEFPELELFRGLIGPTSMQHRYITEDASIGNALFVSLAEMINVPTPVSRALLTLASAINQTDYLKEGRTVDKLGLSGLSIDEMNRYLAEGSR